jgi:hypothetical protein
MSVSIFTRWQSHFTNLSNKTHSSTKFLDLWSITNPNEWTWQIIEVLSITDFKEKTNLKGKSLQTAFRKHLLLLERNWMSKHSRTYCLNKDDKYFS